MGQIYAKVHQDSCNKKWKKYYGYQREGEEEQVTIQVREREGSETERVNDERKEG